jgi:hypothetical protein
VLRLSGLSSQDAFCYFRPGASGTDRGREVRSENLEGTVRFLICTWNSGSDVFGGKIKFINIALYNFFDLSPF